MSKHTKGPWLLDHDNEHIRSAHYHSIVAGCGYHTNGEDIGFEISGCISIDDARLIATAPELLEALEGMLEYFPEGHSDGECFSVETARAAIAKARGEA